MAGKIKAIKLKVLEWAKETYRYKEDYIAPEAPLSIALQWLDANNTSKLESFAITMRTPGHDFELVTGLLYAEGIINLPKDIAQIQYSTNEISFEKPSSVIVKLRKGLEPNPDNFQRNQTMSSACGICGKKYLDSLDSLCPYILKADQPHWHSNILGRLPSRLTNVQDHFESTGGMHAAALFDRNGDIVLMREDIGRHNAVDKVIGAALTSVNLPFADYGLLLSGRAGFELVQKALFAGIPLVASIGAASSMAVHLSSEHGQSLIGFLKEDRMVVYCGENRVILS